MPLHSNYKKIDRLYVALLWIDFVSCFHFLVIIATMTIVPNTCYYFSRVLGQSVGILPESIYLLIKGVSLTLFFLFFFIQVLIYH